jgi:biopolymer transport protein ExbB
MIKFNVVFSYFILGGPFMYPLLLFLFIALFFIIERTIVYTRFNWNTVFHIPSESPVQKSPLQNSFLSSIHTHYHRYKYNSKKFNTFMELDCRNIIGQLERNLNYLTAVSTLAPITGFLGTVTGMIIAFRDIIQAADVSPQLVASGIYEALITTAGGLMITIFTSFFYFIFSGMIKRYSQKMERTVNDVYKQIDNPGETENETE